MANNNPLVSVIIVTYNSSKFVIETLESIKAQTYKSIELIVTDDCSKDDTVAKCRKWLDENKDRFVKTVLVTSPENTGIPKNLNRGIRASSGDWFKTLAGDDTLTKNCVETYINEVKKSPEKLFLFADVYRYKDDFKEENILPEYNTSGLKIAQPDITAKEQFEILLRVNKVWAGSWFVSHKIFDRVGLFDESLRLWEDKPMLLKITQNGIKLHYLDFKSCNYRIHTKSVQALKVQKELVSPFSIEVNRYIINNYHKYLPPFERFVNSIVRGRYVFLDKSGLNKHRTLSKIFMIITSYPWEKIRKKINIKYR